MNQRFVMLLPVVAFCAGCVVVRALDVSIIAPLAIFVVSGAIAIFRSRGWALILMLCALGGVRGIMSSETESKYRTPHVEGVWGDLRHEALLRIEGLELSPRAEVLVRAMVLGDTDGVTYEQRKTYSHSGASHILALSGLHLSVVFVVLNLLLLPVVLLPRGHIVRNILVVTLVWCYAAVVGFTPSVLRSAVMFSVFQFAWVLGRPYSGVNALLFTLFVVTLVNPGLLYTLGFQLSVLAVGAIFFWALPMYKYLFGGRGVVAAMLCVGVSCSVATMPLVSHTFGYVALLGVVFSPLFIATSTLIIIVGFVWLLFPVGVFAPVVRLLIEVGAMLQDRGAEIIASRSWGVLTLRLTQSQMVVIYLIFIVVTLIVWNYVSSKKSEKL